MVEGAVKIGMVGHLGAAPSPPPCQCVNFMPRTGPVGSERNGHERRLRFVAGSPAGTHG